MAGAQNTSSAVMQQRREPPDALDFFPTPPWATRALCVDVLDGDGLGAVWDPCAGEGHMAEVLREYATTVFASDVHDYGMGYAVGSFVGEGLDVIEPPEGFDWLIFNPPFNLAMDFVERALTLAPRVAVLVRTSWLEGGDRFIRLFSKREPNIIAQFCERVPMLKGHWDPGASTATSYCWIVWDSTLGVNEGTIFHWIPPGQRARLTRDDDAKRFGTVAP